MGLNKFRIREYAIIKDNYGNTIKEKKIQRAEEKFLYNDRTYNVIRLKTYHDNIKHLFFTDYRYFYNVNNPNPLSFNNKGKNFAPILDGEIYTRLLENEIIIKLNTVKSNFLKNLTPMQIILGICIIGAIIYFITTGEVTGG